MLSTEYQPSTAATLGMELEIQLVDKQTLDLAPRADEILHTLHQSTTARHFKQEVTRSMLELNSGIHDGSATLEAEMLQLGAQLCAAAAPLGIRPCGGGTHPFQDWRERVHGAWLALVPQLAPPHAVNETPPTAQAKAFSSVRRSKAARVRCCATSAVGRMGAGAGPTASAIVADIIDIARDEYGPAFAMPVDSLDAAPVADAGARVGKHYVRLIVEDRIGVLAEIATAMRDAGMFELSFNDARYLPFEGAGAVSRWRLELPTTLRPFDYSTISDVVMHMSYTARDGGAEFKAAVEAGLVAALNELATMKKPGASRKRVEDGVAWVAFSL